MGQEPPNLNVMDRATLASQLVTDSLGDRLMLLDFSTGRLEPQLAERWEMLGRDQWRLFLRKGVVFHNGEPFDSTAAAWAIDWQTDPKNTSNVGRFLQDTASFVVDALTLDVTCAAACPILPSRITHAHFQAPASARNNPTEFARVSMSNGPYSLVDWAPGESITLTVFEGYWNPGRTPIMDAMVVWSPDPRARAATIATEVAQWAYDIDTESRGVVPRWVSGETTSTIAVKLDARFDLLTSRLGVRRALLEAVDCPGLVRDVLKGLGTCLGVPFQRTATGVGDSFPPFAYDNREARSLIDIEGVAGQQIALYVPDGSPREARLWEAVAADWRRAGLTVELNKVDPRTHLGLWQRGGYPADVTNPAQRPPQAIGFVHTNDLFDPSLSLVFMTCTDFTPSFYCNPEVDALVEEAGRASGQRREQKMAEAIATFREELPIVWWASGAILYGLSSDLRWAPRPDGLVRIDTMRYS